MSSSTSLVDVTVKGSDQVGNNSVLIVGTDSAGSDHYVGSGVVAIGNDIDNNNYVVQMQLDLGNLQLGQLSGSFFVQDHNTLTDIGQFSLNPDGSVGTFSGLSSSTVNSVSSIVQNATGAAGADSLGGVGAAGPQGVPGPANIPGDAASVGIRSVTAARAADGSITYGYSGGSYFDGRRYSSVSDTRSASGTLLNEVRDLNGGGHRVSIYEGGQTLQSDSFDAFDNGAAPDNTFVFDPGHGLDIVNGFRVGGTDHDTLSFLGSDFGDDIADVLANTRNVQGGVVINDPTTQDKVFLSGLHKGQLARNSGDIAFHS